MSRQAPVTTVIELPSGVSVSASCRITTDWESVRRMVEGGVPMAEVAELFKIGHSVIKAKAKQEQWLTPSRVDKLRKQLAQLQRDNFAATGMTKTVVDLKAALWEDRSERWKERMAELVENSLQEAELVSITEAKDLKTVMEVARTLTGESQAEDNAPKLAVNIGFLRGNNAPRVVDVPAELMD